MVRTCVPTIAACMLASSSLAALTSMQADQVPQAFVKAMHAACARAKELGDEFGKA